MKKEAPEASWPSARPRLCVKNDAGSGSWLKRHVKNARGWRSCSFRWSEHLEKKAIFV